MIATLSDADLRRLVKLLNLCSSSYDGEALAAARAAVRLVRERGLSWTDMLQPEAATAANRNLAPWRRVVADCLRQSTFLGQWELAFLRSLSNFPNISTKQRAILAQIADRVARKAAA